MSAKEREKTKDDEMTPKKAFISVLGDYGMKKLWTANYQPAIPFTPQNFDIGNLLPAILYMFRWGHRRGKGQFLEKYGDIQNEKKTYANVDGISKILSQKDEFSGFDTAAAKAILGDMLLSSCLENKNHQTGRLEQVQRAYPAHYLASWIDLPVKVATLRFIPEMLVALLLHQEKGETIQPSNRKTHFGIGCGFDDNLLLSLFGNGMEILGSNRTSLTSDHFKEEDISVGLDQLLTIRLAQGCGAAPTKAKSGEGERIQNQWPIATNAMNALHKDFSVFVQAYGTSIPRQSFLPMLESCLSLGLTNIYFSTINMLLAWEQTGSLPNKEDQRPWSFFVDCSNGNDKALRLLAEESMSHFVRFLGRLPIILMAMRIIDLEVRHDEDLSDSLPEPFPDGTELINFLGSFYKENHPLAGQVISNLKRQCSKIYNILKESDLDQDLQDLLRNANNSPIERLSESLCILMGDNLHTKYHPMVTTSVLMTDLPNGMSQKRKTTQKNKSGKTAKLDVRSIVLTNPMLDFIVHRHLRKAAKGKGSKPLTFIDLLQILKNRYGLYVAESPPGMSIPVEMLLHNKRILERRLRDLGVLVGVNDAESMKRLRQRFRAVGDEE